MKNLIKLLFLLLLSFTLFGCIVDEEECEILIVNNSGYEITSVAVDYGENVLSSNIANGETRSIGDYDESEHYIDIQTTSTDPDDFYSRTIDCSGAGKYAVSVN